MRCSFGYMSGYQPRSSGKKLIHISVDPDGIGPLDPERSANQRKPLLETGWYRPYLGFRWLTEVFYMEAITVICRAQPIHVPAIAQAVSSIRERTYHVVPGTAAYEHMVAEPLLPAKLVELSEWVSRPDSEIFAEVLATSSGGIGGVAVGRRRPERDLDELDYLFIYEEFQGQGWGTKLLEHFCMWAIQRQRVWVLDGNEHALHVYDRQGFKPARYYRDRAIGMRFVAMERELTGGKTA